MQAAASSRRDITFGLSINELPETLLVLMSGGMVAGFLAGLPGPGGGIIFVPCFYFIFCGFFNVPPDVAVPVATGTSLLCMIPTSIAAARSRYKHGHPGTTIIRHGALFMLAGVICGTVISKIYGGRRVASLFGAFLCYYSLRMFFRIKAKPGLISLPSGGRQHFIVFLTATFASMPGTGAAP